MREKIKESFRKPKKIKQTKNIKKTYKVEWDEKWKERSSYSWRMTRSIADWPHELVVHDKDLDLVHLKT